MTTFAWVLHSAIGLLAVIFLTLAPLYLSRFWLWVAPWEPEDLLDIK